jgi:signal transduction histidine kinase
VGGAAPAPPVQRLADLGDLRESLAAAGLDVAFDIDPGARTLPAAVDATCFRVVQEALTNTLRHAGSTSAQVRVVRADGRVLLEVLDSGGTPSRPLRDSGSGHGLTGMRERVAALGGTLDAGPRTSGGWRVAASIPLVQPDASPIGRDVGVAAQ